jgi:hypothetical protein
MVTLFLSYAAFGILIYWLFEIDIPLSIEVRNSSFIGIGVFLLLPIMGMACIKFNEVIKGNKALGYLYLILWMIAIIRFVSTLVRG